MIIPVRMFAFGDNGHVRNVNIPDAEIPQNPHRLTLCELAFYYGQNDFQPIPGIRSVSVGDIVEIPNDRSYLVMPMGFRHLTADEQARYEKMNDDDRFFFVYDDKKRALL